MCVWRPAGGHRSASASPSQSAQGSPQRARSATTSPSQAFQPGPIPASSAPGAQKQSPQLKWVLPAVSMTSQHYCIYLTLLLGGDRESADALSLPLYLSYFRKQTLTLYSKGYTYLSIESNLSPFLFDCSCNKPNYSSVYCTANPSHWPTPSQRHYEEAWPTTRPRLKPSAASGSPSPASSPTRRLSGSFLFLSVIRFGKKKEISSGVSFFLRASAFCSFSFLLHVCDVKLLVQPAVPTRIKHLSLQRPTDLKGFVEVDHQDVSSWRSTTR